nr:S-layer homology domain-containing protein [Paenibacillus flagellatus]
MFPDAASAAATSKTVVVQNSASYPTAVQGQAVTRQIPDLYYNTSQLTLGNDTNEVRPYIQFDLSSIPPDATLTNATLELTSMSSAFNRNNVSATVAVYRVMGAWDENTITWNSASAFDPDPVLSQRVNGFDTASKTQFDLTGLTQQWIDGVVPNDGIVLRSEHFSSGNWVRRYYSDEHLTFGPKLTVTYTVNDLAVTPSQLSLVKGGSGAQLTARFDPDDGTTPSVTWATYDSSIATVDGYGYVTPGHTPGTTTIAATTADGRTAASTVTVSASSNADLINLTLSPGELSPGFHRGTTNYTATVTNSVYSLTVTATVYDPMATVTVNGTPVTSGTASQAIPLNVGYNKIEVTITAEDGVTKKTYTVEVTRQDTASTSPGNEGETDGNGGADTGNGGGSGGGGSTSTTPGNPVDKPDPDKPPGQSGGAACTKLTWTDIQNHWAKSHIESASELCVVQGPSSDKFLPDDEVTRLQFALMVARAMKLPKSGDAAVLDSFKDRDDIPGWAEAELAAAVQAGIIVGYEDVTLRPNVKINRAEMVTMLIRGWKLSAAITATSFADDADIPFWAKGFVAKAEREGIVEGRSNNRFEPSSMATRAEAVAVLVRILQDKP